MLSAGRWGYKNNCLRKSCFLCFKIYQFTKLIALIGYSISQSQLNIEKSSLQMVGGGVASAEYDNSDLITNI